MEPKKSLDQIDYEHFNPSPPPFEGDPIQLSLKPVGADFNSPARSLDLSGPWFLAQDGDQKERLTPKWDDALKAQIPGSIQTALLDAGLIPDPYIGRQDEIAREKSRHTWWLRRSFSVENPDDEYRLVFEGVCDRCCVWLNGEQLGNHQGMFDRFAFDVTGLLKNENEIIVKLDPAPYRIAERKPNEFFEGMNVGWLDSVVINNIFGWHYINLPTMGIWQPVRLDEHPEVTLKDPYVVTMDLESRRLRLVVDLEKDQSRQISGALTLQVSPVNVDGDVYSTSLPISIEPDQEKLVVAFTFPDAKLWWPVGYGSQPLYQLKVQFRSQEAQTSMVETTFGVRTVEMQPTPEGPNPDQYNWTFVVNGKPIFIKGANWCTCDALLRFTSERYERFISLAADSHINLLRAWGSGMPETETFFDLCDQYGVMVLQEWPTAWDSHKVQPYHLLEATVKDCTRRIRSHPSLVMYGGGNESPDPTGRAIEMMGAAAHELDGTRPFHRGEPFGGSIHNYDVYWGRQRLDRNLNLSAVFIGEFGLASVPPMSTVRRYIPEEELNVWPPAPEGGFVHHMPVFNMKGGMARMYQYTGYFTRPDGLAALSLGTQMAQATSIRHTLELARTRWPEHTGVCYYKMNDNNPAASWSSIDWFGTTKIAYHVLRQAYRPLHPCIIFDSLNFVCMDTALPVHILDDQEILSDCSWQLTIRVFNSSLDLVHDMIFDGEGAVAPNAEIGHLRLSAEVTQSIPLFVVMTLQVQGAEPRTAETFYWLNFESGQNALFDLPATKLDLRRDSDRVMVKNVGQKPAVGVFFDPQDPDSFVCEDAFFWLDAGHSRRIVTNQPESVRVMAWNSES